MTTTPNPILVRVVIDHEDLGDDTYHELIPETWGPLRGRVRANRNGISNHRMLFADWQKWVCNNTSCAAFAFVHDDAIRALIDQAAALPDGRLRA